MYQVLVERSAEKDLKNFRSMCDPALFAHCAVSRTMLVQLAAANLLERNTTGGPVSATNRVIYEIADPAKVVRIYRIRHRKEAYR
jgi:hypothetical protein